MLLHFILSMLKVTFGLKNCPLCNTATLIVVDISNQ